MHYDELTDRIDFLLASLELQRIRDEATLPALLHRLAFLQQRISTYRDTPFTLLAERLMLTVTEQQVVTLLAALRSRPDAQAQIRAHTMTNELTLDALRALIYGVSPSLAAHEELAADGTLRRLSIMERNDDHGPNSHESKQTWTIAPSILAMLHGRESIDASLSKLVRRRDTMPALEIATSDDARTIARSAIRSRAVVVAAAMPGLGRRSLLTAVAVDADLVVLELDARRFAKEHVAFAAQLRALARHCRLLGKTPLIGNIDSLDDERIDLLGSELVALVDGPVLITSGVQLPKLDWDRPVIVVEMPPPTSAQRASSGSERSGRWRLRTSTTSRRTIRSHRH